jgi:hypothetical protein
MSNSCLSESPNTHFEHWKLSTSHFFAHATFVRYATYLVDVLQFVNNLTNHWLGALHFQLMEVELIFHPISRCLLAVSVKVKVKRFVKEILKGKADCTWHQQSSWPQILFSLLDYGMIPWCKSKPFQIESTINQWRTFNPQSTNIQSPFLLNVGDTTMNKTDKVSALIVLSI